MRELLAAVVLVAVALPAPTAFPATQAPTAFLATPGRVDDPLDQARRAAEGLSFTGLVEVSWTDAGGAQSDDLAVSARGGTIEVRGGTSVLAAGLTRLVQRAGGQWALLWSGALATTGRPDTSAKYQIVDGGTARVAARPASVTEVREAALLRERLYLDNATGLLLRREQFGPAGAVDRVVGFRTLVVDGATPAPEMPTVVSDQSPRRVSPARVPSSAPAPARLPGGYDRVGIYRQGSVLQVLYSDGLYDLSVFEQRGRLASEDVPPAGDRVDVGGRRGWTYAWPGGHVLLWHAGHTVYTVVSDAPADQVAGAARSLPAGGGGASVGARVRRAFAALVAPLG